MKEAKIQVLYEGGPPLQLVIAGDVAMPVKATPAFIGGPKGKTSAGTVVIESVDGRPSGCSGWWSAAGGRRCTCRGNECTSRAGMGRRSGGRPLPEHMVDRLHRPPGLSGPPTPYPQSRDRAGPTWVATIVTGPSTNASSTRNASRRVSPPCSTWSSHYNPRQRGQVSMPQWRNLRSISSLSPNATAEMVAVTPISRDEIRVSFRFTPAPDFSGPLDVRIRIETETGGECSVLALVD